MCLIRLVVNIPNGIFLAFGIVFLSGTDHTAGLGRVLRQRILTVVGIDTGIDQEPPAAVTTPLGDKATTIMISFLDLLCIYKSPL